MKLVSLVFVMPKNSHVFFGWTNLIGHNFIYMFVQDIIKIGLIAHTMYMQYYIS